MNLMERLNQALAFIKKTPVVKEAATLSQALPAEYFRTLNPDILAKMAHTQSRKDFWRQVARMAREVQDDQLYKTAKQQYEAPPEQQDMAFLKDLRKQAKDWANERKAGAPRHNPLSRDRSAPDTLHMSPNEKEAQFQAKSQAQQNAPERKYGDEQVFGVFDPSGQLIKGPFATDLEAKSYVAANIPDPSSIQIQQYENPKSYGKLKATRGPLQSGWTEEEVVKAMRPMIRYFAWKFQSPKSPLEDLEQAGAIGVLNALRTDKADAPFGSHAAKHIKGEIRRQALKSGTVAGSEVAGGQSFGQQGGNNGYEVVWAKADNPSDSGNKFFAADPSAFKDYFSKTGRTPPRSIDPQFKAAQELVKQLRAGGYEAAIRDKRGSMASTETPVGGGEQQSTLGAGLRSNKVRTPFQVAMTKDEIQKLKSLAKLTPQQEKVIDLTFGLDDPEGSAAGPSMGDTDARLKGKMGPVERGDETKKPGEQPGKTPEEAGVQSDMAKQDSSVPLGKYAAVGGEPKLTPTMDPKTNKPAKLAATRGPVEIGKMLGVSTEKIRQHRAKALMKLQQAAAQLAAQEPKNVEKMQAKRKNEVILPDYPGQGGVPADAGIDQQKPSAQTKSFVDNANQTDWMKDEWGPAQKEKMEQYEKFFRNMLVEMIFSGEMNGMILG